MSLSVGFEWISRDEREKMVLFVFFYELIVIFLTYLERIFIQINFFLISHRLWALLWWGIYAIWKSCWCCFWSWRKCCCSPTDDGPTKSSLPHFSQVCSHCGILADTWSALSSVCLKVSHGSNRVSLFELISSCKRSLPGHSQMKDWCDMQRYLFGMAINPGMIPSWLSGFQIIVPGCSQNVSGECPYFGSKRKWCNLDRAPKWGILSCWIPGTVF